MARALLERETISGEEVRRLIELSVGQVADTNGTNGSNGTTTAASPTEPAAPAASGGDPT